MIDPNGSYTFAMWIFHVWGYDGEDDGKYMVVFTILLYLYDIVQK